MLIEPNHWSMAKEYFEKNPKAKKFIPNPTTSLYSFLKTVQGGIFALPRKRDRDAHILGTGTFSLVLTAQNEAGKEVACRTFNADYILEDDHSLEVLRHLNLLLGNTIRSKKHAKKVTIEKKTIPFHHKGFQFIPLAPGRTLHQLVLETSTKKRPALSEIQKDIIALKCCLALHDYQEKKTIHGDINSQNVLICLQNDITVTFVDHGFSLLLKGSEKVKKLRKSRGTLGFAAPEIVNHGLYSYHSDLYALGSLFILLGRKEWAKWLHATVPEERVTLQQMLFKIWQKINKNTAQVLAPYRHAIAQTEDILADCFAEELEKGISLELLIENNLIKFLFDAHEINLIALYMCKSFYDAWQNSNHNARIYSANNFKILRKNNTPHVVFQKSFDQDSTFMTSETKNYTIKSAVYSLSKILVHLDIVSDESFKNPDDRPDLVHYLIMICDLALQEKGENPYKARLEELRRYFIEKPSTTFTEGEVLSVVSDLPHPPSSAPEAEGLAEHDSDSSLGNSSHLLDDESYEGSEPLQFELELELEIVANLSLKPKPVLTQYSRKNNAANDSAPSTGVTTKPRVS